LTSNGSIAKLILFRASHYPIIRIDYRRSFNLYCVQIVCGTKFDIEIVK